MRDVTPYLNIGHDILKIPCLLLSVFSTVSTCLELRLDSSLVVNSEAQAAAQASYLYSSWVKIGMREGCRTVISTKVLLVFTGSPSS